MQRKLRAAAAAARAKTPTAELIRTPPKTAANQVKVPDYSRRRVISSFGVLPRDAYGLAVVKGAVDYTDGDTAELATFEWTCPAGRAALIRKLAWAFRVETLSEAGLTVAVKIEGSGFPGVDAVTQTANLEVFGIVRPGQKVTVEIRRPLVGLSWRAFYAASGIDPDDYTNRFRVELSGDLLPYDSVTMPDVADVVLTGRIY